VVVAVAGELAVVAVGVLVAELAVSVIAVVQAVLARRGEPDAL
jgi:hypothetical protein